MAKVFIVNEPRNPGENSSTVFDVTPAAMFGEVVFVYKISDPRPDRDLGWALETAHRVLGTAEKGDFLVWAGGDPMTLAIAGAILADVTDGQFNFLAWNRGIGSYTPVPLNLFNETAT